MFLASNGKVYGVGYNCYGNLGIGNTNNENYIPPFNTKST